MEGRYNIRSPAVKRLMKEAQELSEPTDQYFAQPLEDNLFEWHFTVRGPADSDFEGGIYHGRIILPVDYPMKPPSIIWLTPNGRFETNKKICLSISGHHPESWRPSWSIRTALLAIIGFMPTNSVGAIGSVDYKPEERKILAKKSRAWKCQACGDVSGCLLEVTSDSNPSSTKEAQELASQISFQGEKPKAAATDDKVKTDDQKSPKEEKGGANPETRCQPGNEATTSAADTTAQPSPTQLPAASIAADISAAGGFHPTLAYTSTSSGSAAFAMPTSQSVPTGYPGYPWNPSQPFPPFAFYPPGQMQSYNPSAMPPRFPYPPSHYPSPPASTPSFHPSGFALPPNMAMMMMPPSYPLPPMPSSFTSAGNVPSPVSTNNSSLPGASPKSNVPTSQSSGSNEHSSVSAPLSSSNTHESEVKASEGKGKKLSTSLKSSEKKSDETEDDDAQRSDKKQVFNELLSKVKRVGSDTDKLVVGSEPTDIGEGSDTTNKALSSDADKGLMSDPANKVLEQPSSDKADKKEDFQDIPVINSRSQVTEELATGSEVSRSRPKEENAGGEEVSKSEVVPSDTENSEAGVPPLEVSESEPRSVHERSTCNSLSELEKLKGKPAAKGLRQRQSAMASISPEALGETLPGADESGASGGTASAGSGTGQRIEAESGDACRRNRMPPEMVNPPLRVRAAQTVQNQARSLDRARPNSSSFDSTFFIMVVLLICIAGILLNRVLIMVNGDSLQNEEV